MKLFVSRHFSLGSLSNKLGLVDVHWCNRSFNIAPSDAADVCPFLSMDFPIWGTFYPTYDHVITQVIGSYLSYDSSEIMSGAAEERKRWRRVRATHSKEARGLRRELGDSMIHISQLMRCEMELGIVLPCSFLLIELLRLPRKWLLQPSSLHWMCCM